MKAHVRTTRSILISAAATLAVAHTAVQAEDYPTRPITFVVGYSAGGAIDQSARLLGKELASRWGQPVVVDNRPGANGVIAATAVANAAPDGYTLLVTATSHNLNKFVNKNLSYDVTTSFTPVAVTVEVSNVLVVNADSPYQTVGQLITALKDPSKKLSYASQGVGGIPHMAGELFKIRTGTDMLHVPYKGAALALTDLMGGVVDMSFPSTGSAMGYIQQGKLRALAVASNERVEQLKNVPTFSESGVPDYTVSTWHGILAPAGTPPAIVNKLNAEINDIIQTPAFQEALLTQGNMAAKPLSPQAFGDKLARELKTYGDLAEAINLGGS